MASRRKVAAAGKRGPPSALLSPASSEDEAPEELSFGAAKEAAQTERKLVGEAARRHRELLKEKRRRRQELFAEQKVRPPPLESRRPRRGQPPPRSLPSPRRSGSCSPRPCCRSWPPRRPGEGAGPGERCLPPGVRPLGTLARGGFGLGASKGNYTAVRLKDQSVIGLHQQLAKDFLNIQLYGPAANRAQANDFFSLENKKNPVKKAAVQFVDKSWGKYKKSK
ncbi:NOL7 protein, partial [Syrrhaptes paradoxus]|nr:NOL7 protein [Syrrhaptes paradoxus]